MEMGWIGYNPWQMPVFYLSPDLPSSPLGIDFTAFIHRNYRQDRIVRLRGMS